MVSLTGRTRAAKLAVSRQISECEEPVLRKKRLLVASPPNWSINAGRWARFSLAPRIWTFSLSAVELERPLHPLWQSVGLMCLMSLWQFHTEHLFANLKFLMFKTDGSHFSAASSSISWPLAARVLFLTQVWFLDCSWTRGLAHLYLYH